MPVQIKWLANASFRISDDRLVLYIDPYKLSGHPHDADVVFVSHSHFDHFSPPDIEGVSTADTIVLAPADPGDKLPQSMRIEPGKTLTVRSLTVETVPSYNIGKEFHPRSKNWCGAVFTLSAKRIYYAGDTDHVPEMAGLESVDLALLPVAGTYLMTASEAAGACEAIAPKAAMPYHWGDIIGGQDDADAFARAVKCCPVHVVPAGRSLTL